jgi:hypothetical protein
MGMASKIVSSIIFSCVLFDIAGLVTTIDPPLGTLNDADCPTGTSGLVYVVRNPVHYTGIQSLVVFSGLRDADSNSTNWAEQQLGLTLQLGPNHGLDQPQIKPWLEGRFAQQEKISQASQLEEAGFCRPSSPDFRMVFWSGPCAGQHQVACRM